jgi:hypothetical protein
MARLKDNLGRFIQSETLIMKPCIICGGVFKSYTYQNAKHCSRKCYGATISARQSGRKVSEQERLRLISIRPKVSPMKGKHLSEEAKAMISLKKTGAPLTQVQIDGYKNRRNSIPVKKNIEYRKWLDSFRKCAGWREWRKAVFLRDDYTCKSCGKRSGDIEGEQVYLEPHHIFPVRKLYEYNFMQHILNVENGVTLCRPCHRNTLGG